MTNKTLREEFEKFVNSDEHPVWGSKTVNEMFDWFESKLNQRETEVREETIGEIDDYIRRYSTPMEILEGNTGVAVEKTFAHILDFLQSLNQNTK